MKGFFFVYVMNFLKNDFFFVLVIFVKFFILGLFVGGFKNIICCLLEERYVYFFFWDFLFDIVKEIWMFI